MSYLVQRGSCLHFRFTLPTKWQALAARREIRLSLGPKTKREGNRIAKQLYSAAHKTLGVNMEKLKPEEIVTKLRNQLVKELRQLEGLAEENPEFVYGSGDDSIDNIESLDTLIEENQDIVKSADHTSTLYMDEDNLADIFERKPSDLTEDELKRINFHYLLNSTKYLKALREICENPFFDVNQYISQIQPRAGNVSTGSSKKISEVVEEFLQKYVKEINKDTYQKRAKHLGYLVHLLEDCAIADITHDAMRHAVLQIEKMPVQNENPYRGMSVEELFAVENPSKTIGHKTVGTIRESWSKFQQYCLDNEYFTSNFLKGKFTKLSNAEAIEDDEEKHYDQFSEQDLQAIFDLTNLNRRKRKFSTFWYMLLGLYTGLRSGEIAQLTKHDIIQLDDGHYYVSVNRSPIEKGGKPKKVKTNSSIRTVPLHDDLLELGLLQWVSERENRLFDMNAQSGRQAHEMTKFMSVYLTDLNIKTPKKVFHSFRKNVNVLIFENGDSLHGKLWLGHKITDINVENYLPKSRRPYVLRKQALPHINYPLDIEALKAHKDARP